MWVLFCLCENPCEKIHQTGHPTRPLRVFLHLPDDSIKIKRGDIEIFIAIMKTIRIDISSGRVNLFQIEEPIVNKKNMLQTFIPPGVALKEITSDITGLESLKPVTIIAPHDDETEFEYKRKLMSPREVLRC